VGAVVGIVAGGAGSGGEDKEGTSATRDLQMIEDRLECYGRPTKEQSERFSSLRAGLLSQDPGLVDAIDTNDSPAKMALCWLADFDDFKVDVSQGKEPDVLQRFVLALMYRHFVGDIITSSTAKFHPLTISRWLSNSPVCSWKGVSCDTDETNGDVVSELDLTGMQLEGSIPTELFLLTHLTSLLLSTNQLTGRIPVEIAALTQLESLDFDGNPLIGQIPSELFELPWLEKLSFFANLLSGTVPANLSNATNLAFLGMSQLSALTGTLPDLRRLRRLKTLYIAQVPLVGHFPALSESSHRGESQSQAARTGECDHISCICDCASCAESVLTTMPWLV